jgi:hypothetical protein
VDDTACMAVGSRALFLSLYREIDSPTSYMNPTLDIESCKS